MNPAELQQAKAVELIDATSGDLRAHDYVVAQLKITPLTLDQLQEQTGISKRTIQKIRSGEIIDPGVSHIETLANFFWKMDNPAGRE